MYAKKTEENNQSYFPEIMNSQYLSHENMIHPTGMIML
jgi:hypothetical protein